MKISEIRKNTRNLLKMVHHNFVVARSKFGLVEWPHLESQTISGLIPKRDCGFNMQIALCIFGIECAACVDNIEPIGQIAVSAFATQTLPHQNRNISLRPR